MATEPEPREPFLRLYRADHAKHLSCIEVEGELHVSTGGRWRSLLRGVLAAPVDGLAVDLRGCTAIDSSSFEELQAASSKLTGDGNPGVVLVMLPASPLSLELRFAGRNALPNYATAQDAIAALAG